MEENVLRLPLREPDPERLGELVPSEGLPGIRVDPATGSKFYRLDWLRDDLAAERDHEELVSPVASVPRAEEAPEHLEDRDEIFRRIEIDRANRARARLGTYEDGTPVLAPLEFDAEAAANLRKQMAALRPPNETVPMRTNLGTEPTYDELLVYGLKRILSPLQAAARQYRSLAAVVPEKAKQKLLARARQLDEMLDELSS